MPRVLSAVENPLAVVPASAPLLAAAPEPQRCRRGREILIKEDLYWILNGLSKGTFRITDASSCSAGKVMLCNVKPCASPQVCAVVSAPSAALWRSRGHGSSL
ncbi:hypothetical protein DPX16_16194 [Anabarilius grahami]|uniref:Uncharacterized protein n=1 Tax=Anabarilius grahami TaxID=495550 RepID=A0A3N0XFE2_ANAGA|nr:hypothetical protein DPX16_16194 [Anabarilius grahami]